MGMDNSLVHFIRVAGDTFRRWIYPDYLPRLPPEIHMIEMCFKPASHWPASRALFGLYVEGEPALSSCGRTFIQLILKTEIFFSPEVNFSPYCSSFMVQLTYRNCNEPKVANIMFHEL
jgi:hypothetical protein